MWIPVRKSGETAAADAAIGGGVVDSSGNWDTSSLLTALPAEPVSIKAQVRLSGDPRTTRRGPASETSMCGGSRPRLR
ncbi:hypothetical protein Slala05_76800 [Streptomyces lavendulae subsp. lavendulae]|nr:hypothetical protein Slala05_76800 [Streptomyces lavendulae subsp. lavendulae]